MVCFFNLRRELQWWRCRKEKEGGGGKESKFGQKKVNGTEGLLGEEGKLDVGIKQFWKPSLVQRQSLKFYY